MGSIEPTDRPPPGESYRRLADRLMKEADEHFEGKHFPAAEETVRELLRLQKRVLGEHHPHYADCLSMLAELRFVQDDLKGAEAQIRRVLEIRGRVLGERHLDFATSLNSLALLLGYQGELAAAEPFLSRALALREQVLGERHPDTLRTRQAVEALRQRLQEADVPTEPVAETPTPTSLSADHTALRVWFDELQGRLIGAAEALQLAGELPTQTLLDELYECRQGFDQFCARARELATELGIAQPTPQELGNLQQITAFLDVIARTFALKARREAARRLALAILDDALAITHPSRPDFSSLEDCRSHARALHERLTAASWEELPEEANELASGAHPIAHLVLLARDREQLSDDDWASLHRSISATFGRALAAAASRGNLVLNSDYTRQAAALPAPDPEPPLAVAIEEPIPCPAPVIAAPHPVIPTAPVIGGPLSLSAAQPHAIPSVSLWLADKNARFLKLPGRGERLPSPTAALPSPREKLAPLTIFRRTVKLFGRPFSSS